MPGGDNQLEIEVALRDSTSGVLKEIARQLDTVTKKMVDTGKAGSAAFDKVNESAKRSHENTKHAHAGLTGIGGAMSGVAKGTLVLAGGFVAMGKALGNFAAQRVQLQLLTTDIGFTTQQISIMKQTLARKGITDGGEQQAIITGLGGQFKEAQTFGVEASQLFDRFAKYGNAALGEQIVKATKNNDFKKAMDMAAGEYARQAKSNKARAYYFATVVMQTQPSVLEDWFKTQEGVQAIQTSSYLESKEYLVKQEQVANAVNTVVNKSLELTIKSILGIEKAYSEFAASSAVASFLAPVVNDAEGRPDTGLLVPGEMGMTFPSAPSPHQQEQVEGRAAGGPAHVGRSYLVGERGPEMFSPSESGVVRASYTKSDATVKDLAEAERESNKALKDIRDTLKQMEDDSFAAGMSGAGSASMPFRPGITRGGGAAGGASLGPGSIGALGGAVHGYGVDAYAGQTGQKLFDPMSGTLGGGLGGSSAAFGPGQHMGIDIMGKRGSPVYAIKDGVIVRAPKPGGGIDQVLTIRHADGTYTRYLHQGYLPGIEPGQFHQGGTVVGSSGYRNADHSHVEFRVGEPGARGSKLGNLRAIMGWDNKNLPVGGKERVGAGPSYGPSMAGPGGLTAGPRGAVDPAALHARLRDLVSQSSLAGYMPADAAKYGFKTGSPEEWAGLLSGIAGWESGNKAGATGDSGGSHGLFQLSPQDAITYGLQKTPFTAAQLADPDFNARMGVAIAAIRAHAGGVGGPEGMAKYWAGHGKPTSYLAQGRVQAGADSETARKIMDERTKAAARTGTVTASVDFGDFMKAQDVDSVFKTLKMPSTRQNAPVREGTVVGGDPGHSIWAP